MKIETLNPLWYNGFTPKTYTSRNFEKGIQDLMDNIIPICCPKCNSHSLYKYGKNKFGNQKYQCRKCKHQFAPDFVPSGSRGAKPLPPEQRKYPSCPVCGKSAFLHHDYDDYSNYRCSDKKCNHSFFQAKPTVKLPPSMSNIIGKDNFKRMRHSIHLVITALTMFYIGGASFRKIALMLNILYNIKVSHVTISDWCKKFAPIFHTKMLTLMPAMNFDSDEWHADETVVKILGKKYYIWFIIDSETRFVLGFHLSPHRDSPQAFSLFNSVKQYGKPNAIVTDRYSAYKVPTKSIFGVKHIRVASFKDDISNNVIEAFNKQFKYWYKTRYGFNSFESANSMIMMFVFFYNFIRPHSSLSDLTPAEVAGFKCSERQRNSLLLVS